MNDAEIRRQYFDKFKACPLNTMEKWLIEEEITDILYEKGYDLVNCGTAHCSHGVFNALHCYSTVAEKLTGEVLKHGFEVILRKNPEKRSESWIIFPFNLLIELRDVVEKFEVIK